MIDNGKRCFVMWELTREDRVRYDPVVYTNTADLIETGEKRKDEKKIKDYNYSVVFQPEFPEISDMKQSQPYGRMG